MYTIDGKLVQNEKEFRDHCANNVTESGKPFKQDFRVAAQAYKLPVIQLVELLEKHGHSVEKTEPQK